MADVLEAGWISPVELKVAADSVRHKYNPTYLILSRDDFNRLVNATMVHPIGHPIVKGYIEAGIEKVVWGDDVSDGEFLLSSGKGIDSTVETLVLKE